MSLEGRRTSIAARVHVDAEDADGGRVPSSRELAR